MNDETIQTLQTALDDIEAKITEAQTTQASLAEQAVALNAQIKENDEALSKYISIRNDLIASIEMLTEEEVDPDHPDQEEPIVDANPEDINNEDYDDLEYV